MSGVDSSSGGKSWKSKSSISAVASCCDWATCSRLGCLDLFLKLKAPRRDVCPEGVACMLDDRLGRRLKFGAVGAPLAKARLLDGARLAALVRWGAIWAAEGSSMSLVRFLPDPESLEASVATTDDRLLPCTR